MPGKVLPDNQRLWIILATLLAVPLPLERDHQMGYLTKIPTLKPAGDVNGV
jgi:hypothetical protein